MTGKYHRSCAPEIDLTNLDLPHGGYSKQDTEGSTDHAMASVTGCPRWKADLAGLQYTLPPSPITMVASQHSSDQYQQPEVCRAFAIIFS